MNSDQTRVSGDIAQVGQRMQGIQTKHRDITVEIFISEHCMICAYAEEVAAIIRRDFPTVKLHVIDIHKTTAPIPERVFATPTYLLNGRVWSLGNPSLEQVAETLGALVN